MQEVFMNGFVGELEKIAKTDKTEKPWHNVSGLRKLRARGMSEDALKVNLQKAGGPGTFRGRVFASVLKDRGYSDKSINKAWKTGGKGWGVW